MKARMDTTNKSIKNYQTPRWANVFSSRIKPPDKNKNDENNFIQVLVFKATTEIDLLQKKIACLSGTSLKLTLSMREIDQNIDYFVGNMLTQFEEIKICFEIENC
ncbi:hypothetical protein AYI69_g5156 [Smittium culicis]|uniref:Uncharacterized protein n=1 Tax=Smittium culicis TaxID=133412 RepID=A0A1R1Y8H0_9FUNG|nr:hypothetical protein AYI69_g5156 [Smittium culicis]